MSPLARSFAGLSADAAAEMVMREMHDWLGMDEPATRRAMALEISHKPPFENTMAALRAAAVEAYRAVMWKQSIRFTRMEQEIEQQGWQNFIDRATEALAQ